MGINPEFHAGLLAVAAITTVLFAFVVLARNPQSTPARLHAGYGAVVGWWFVCTALIATGHDLQLWGRLAHLSIGMLPGIVFHLNVSTAGVAHKHQRSIRWHYAVSAVITLISVSWPVFRAVPNVYSWGPYPAYSWLGILPAGALAVAFSEVLWIYGRELRRAERGSVLREKLVAFQQGNVVATLSMIDFLPAFGVAIYPMAFLVLTFLNVAATAGSVRFRLIEITPEFAAEEILETLPEAVIAVDSQHVIKLANNAAARLFGSDVSDLVDASLLDVVCAPALLEVLAVPVSTPSGVREISFRGKHGEQFVMRINDRTLLDQRGGPVARVWVLHDLTAQRVAEAEKEMFEGWVRKGQRLESLGVLAGGIAHDFNNLLTVILGQADVARIRRSTGADVDDQLAAIVGASLRAEELTAQMLTYAGRGEASRSVIDLNSVTREIGELLHVALSKKATLVFDLDTDLPPIQADESQMSQVILNLVTNASDALGDESGVITVRTGCYDAASAVDRGLEPDRAHVFVEVEDTGVGMDSETRSRVFDPFYTTKSAGRGLGLATVFGIVQAHDGSIRVESEIGVGSRFTVALPSAAGPMAEHQNSGADPLTSGQGLALLVDDEPAVRAVLREMLKTIGFEVIEAKNGTEAIEIFRACEGDISVVLLDVAMPEMDGGQALSVIRTHSPDVPVILMSGHASAGSLDLSSDPPTSFLKKPFQAAELAQQLRASQVVRPERQPRTDHSNSSSRS